MTDMEGTTADPTYLTYSEDGKQRHGHLLGLFGISELEELTDRWVLTNRRLYYDVAAWLAVKNLNERQSDIIPSLPSLLGDDCDFHWTYEARDTQNSQANGVGDLLAATEEPRSVSTTTSTGSNANSTKWQHPYAIAGGVFSSVTLPMSTLSGAYGMPFISGSATSSALDAKPLFSRTLPTNAADAHAAMIYYSNLGVTHVAIFFEKDPYGESYNALLHVSAKRVGITLVSIPFTMQDLEESVQRLKQTGFRYIYSVMQNREEALIAAVEGGVLGNEKYSWICAEMENFKALEFQLSNEDPRDRSLAQALDGIGVFVLAFPEHERFQSALTDFSNNPEMQADFIAAHPEQDTRELLEFPPPQFNVAQPAFYDAVIALGIASCRTPGLFTGAEMHKTLLNTTFEGTTGQVAFDSRTGTRSVDSARFRLDSMFVSEERSDDNFTRFGYRLSNIVLDGKVEQVDDYLYYGNSTIPPASLPQLEHDYNLIPLGVQITGWVLGAVVMLVSAGLIIGTIVKRHDYVVRAG